MKLRLSEENDKMMVKYDETMVKYDETMVKYDKTKHTLQSYSSHHATIAHLSQSDPNSAYHCYGTRYQNEGNF